MEVWQNGRNSCYTYFRITGDFEPDEISNMLGLSPRESWRIGDFRRNGRSKFDFASWEYGRCDEYDVIVANQMMKTIHDLLPKIEVLCAIRELYSVDFTLEIVPSICAGEINPCLAPNREVIEFCYLTKTDIDIDLYVSGGCNDATDE